MEEFGETTTEKGHKVFFSGRENKHEQSVGFLVRKDIVNTVMGCHTVSSSLITIRQRAIPFNITMLHSRQSISFSDRLAKATDCSSPLFCHGSKTATSPQVLQSAESTVSRSEPYSFSVSGKTRSIFRQQRRLVTFHPGPRSIFPQSISQWLGPLARLGMTVLDHAPEFSDVQHAVRLLHVQNCLYLGLRLLHSLLVEDLVQVVRQSGCLLKLSLIHI